MKTITLISLSLRDFQGGTVTINADGNDVDVLATNGAGKTRLASAFSWLLFDKDSLGRADFEIKNTNARGEKEPNLEHTVEAVLLVDGQTITLKKIYKETYTKKRGSPIASFTGHTQDYFVDGVPVRKKDYVQRITEIAGAEETFHMLTSPTVFPSLHWAKQRSLLLDVCGDMTDAAVIETDAKLHPLVDILKKYTSSKSPMDDHKKVIASRRAEINKKMVELPARIDEVRRSLPDLTGLSAQTIVDAEVARLDTAVNDAKLKLQGVDTGGSIAELSRQLELVNADKKKLEAFHYTEAIRTANSIDQQRTEASFRITGGKRSVVSISGDITSKSTKISNIELEQVRLRKQWYEVDGRAFQDTVLEACASCGQELPVDKVQAAREKAMAAFNSDKATLIGDIELRGGQLTGEKNQLQDEIAALTIARESQLKASQDDEALLESLTVQFEAAKLHATDYPSVPGWNEFSIQQASLQGQIEVERSRSAPDTEKLKSEITVLELQRSAAKENADKFTKRKDGEKRIEDLKLEEKKLATEFERLESELFLCEQFIRTKVRLLTDRINSHFEICRFKLFDELINGGLSECCEITVNGIPYNSGLNNAARINAGLDVCRTLSTHYGLLAPIFVDNAESVVSLISMDAQVIRLVVSEKDAVLRVEASRQLVAA